MLLRVYAYFCLEIPLYYAPKSICLFLFGEFWSFFKVHALNYKNENYVASKLNCNTVIWLISRYSYFLNFDFRQIKSSYGKSWNHEQENYRGWVSMGARGTISPTKFENCLRISTHEIWGTAYCSTHKICHLVLCYSN